MITTGQPLQVSELDFNQIKTNLIDYFKNKETGFTDWDFEGSNLNTVIDLLAYNTHYNAMLAHMAVNESFIDSAQLRSSIVSAAKLLGYVPRSRSSATINCNISNLNLGSFSNNVFSFERGQEFVTTFNNRSYIFTLINSSGTLTRNNDNSYSGNILLNQGKLKEIRFIANGYDNGASYEIPDESVDIGTLRVFVQEDISSTTQTTFLQYKDISQVDSTSPIYFINENSSGRYELTFGNGVFGKKLLPGNIIIIDYLISDGIEGNGINSNLTSSITLNGNFINVVCNPTNRSSGGGEKENADTLKTNAITGFTTQNRAVTADDYRNLIIKNFPNINSISVWGGEDNTPPAYGKVFISANEKSGDDNISELSPHSKDSILSYLRTKKVLSILPEIIDPEYCNIVLDIFVKYNPNISRLTSNEIQNQIRIFIEDYNNNSLNAFDSIFRHSQFVRNIDTSVPSILNSLVRVYLSQSIQLTSNLTGPYILKFGATCALDDNKAIISVIQSNGVWTINDENVYLGDEASPLLGVRTIFTYTLLNGVQNKIQNVGSFDLTNGVMTLNRLFSDQPVNLDIIVNSLSNDIVSKRNTLLNIDFDNTTVNVFADEIARGGNSRTVEYITFPKER